jgi:hypothetical protein
MDGSSCLLMVGTRMLVVMDEKLPEALRGGQGDINSQARGKLAENRRHKRLN